MTTARILESAERRLLGSIKHDEAAERLAANVERVRKAQLGRIKAKNYSDYPTNVSEKTLRIRANLAEAKVSWEQMSVDEIVALYAKLLNR